MALKRDIHPKIDEFRNMDVLERRAKGEIVEEDPSELKKIASVPKKTKKAKEKVKQ